MDEIFAKLEGGQPLTPSEISMFYREYNKAHGSQIRHDGSLAKVVTLFRVWKKELEAAKVKAEPKAEVKTEVPTTTEKKK